MPPKREYKTFANLNSKLVRKQRLASILTSAKELLVEYEECDRKIDIPEWPQVVDLFSDITEGEMMVMEHQKMKVLKSWNSSDES